MPLPDESSRIDELKKSLYSRNAPDVRTRRKLRFTDVEPTVQTSWKDPNEVTEPVHLNTAYEHHSMSFTTKLLIGSLIFCLIAVGIGAYLFFNGGNLISANNIDITISGPVSIPGGEPVSFDIKVTNNNNVDLQLADLGVEFPTGTTDPNDPTTELKIARDLIGDVPAGGSSVKTFKAIVFGEENLQKQINVTVTYKVKGSTALFTKTKSYDILINSSPLVLTVSSFREVTAGQAFDLTVDLKSNSQETLKNILLKGAYPFGFAYTSSNIPTIGGNSSWKIGDIPPGGTRKVVIHGRLDGEDSDTRVFRFSAGAQSANNPQQIGTYYMTAEQDIAIKKAFISMKISVAEDDSVTDHVAEPGKLERVKISWFNNLPSTISNVQIVAKLAGTAYDKNTIVVDSGYFDSINNQIVWNRQSNPELGSVGAGDNGTVAFSITPKDPTLSASPVTNPSYSIVTNVSGNRTQDSNVPTTLTSVVSRTVKIASRVSLAGRVVRSIGPFTNTGPVPPRVEQTTTYTVIWDVDNTSNPVSNAVVTAKLPQNIKWLGAVNPTTADLTYDTNSGLITWNTGTVSTYTLNSSRRREVTFQISYTPSVTDVAQIPTLVGQATLVATDDFTGARLQNSQDALSSRFSTDPAYKQGDESVSR